MGAPKMQWVPLHTCRINTHAHKRKINKWHGEVFVFKLASLQSTWTAGLMEMTNIFSQEHLP